MKRMTSKNKKKATSIAMIVMLALFVVFILMVIINAISNFNDEKRLAAFTVEAGSLCTEYLVNIDVSNIVETTNSPSQEQLLIDAQSSIDAYSELADESHEFEELANMQSLLDLLKALNLDAHRWDELDEETASQYQILIVSAQLKDAE